MKIGKIISVEYDKFRLRLFHTTRNSSVNIDGEVYYFGNIGSYLKSINSAGEYILCEVLSIVDFVSKDNKDYGNYNLDSSREILMKPIGTLMHEKFNLGVGIFPSLYSDVEVVTFNDLNLILSCKEEQDVTNGIHSTISIGTSKSLINYNIEIDINRFFNIHSAVLGNSGSGKSNTIAHILQEVFQKQDNEAVGSKTIIFDANGEYPIAFDNTAKLKIEPIFYKPNIAKDEEGIYKRFVLPYYLMNLDEWLSFLMASERTQKPFWDRVLQECYKFYKIFNTQDKNEAQQFTNYIKWRLQQILFNIVGRIDSDTSKMTAAKGAIGMMRKICKEQLGKDVNDETFKDLSNFLDVCNQLCDVYYGDNKDRLSNALPLFISTEATTKYVYLKDQKAEFTIEKKSGAFLQINENDAISIDQNKLISGDYFDYKYLKTAADIVLLDEEAKGNLHIRDFTSTLMSRLDYFLLNPECEFMRIVSKEYSNCDDYLEKVFNISDSKERNKQLITIDSSTMGIDAMELMTSVVARMVFDYRKQKDGKSRQEKPIHLILDEAHRYIRKDENYIIRENIFEKIAREGRKYSLYLIISSQRPSELSQTVLSQCGNYIVHRIQNDVDMKYIYSVLPYFSEDYITKIRQAVPGEALIFGNCVPMPLMVKVKEANPAPNSKNCDIKMEWFYKETTTD